MCSIRHVYFAHSGKNDAIFELRPRASPGDGSGAPLRTVLNWESVDSTLQNDVVID